MLDSLAPWLIVAVLLVVMRQLERSLHQHIFKVGWLLTKKLETTTILYYLFFLPGVAMHEIILWLVAGILNVRAERSIAWPESQAVAELRLNFVKLNKNTGSLKTAIISISPLVFGVLFIGFVANNMLRVSDFVAALGDQPLDNLGTAIGVLTATTDFWLWVYLVFAVGNTMWPDVKALRGWKPILFGLVIAIVILYLAGLGDAFVGRGLMIPVNQGLNILSGALAVITVVDLFFTAVLGGIESLIERVSGDSATFQNGKLVAMRRDEIQKMRQQQREREAKQAAAARVQRDAGPPSIYKFPFPIPTAPGKDAEPITVTKEEPAPLPAGSAGRAGAPLITGTAATVKPPEPKPAAPPAAEKRTESLLVGKPPTPPVVAKPSDEPKSEDAKSDPIVVRKPDGDPLKTAEAEKPEDIKTRPLDDEDDEDLDEEEDQEEVDERS